MTKETYEEIHNTRKKLQLVVVLIAFSTFFITRLVICVICAILCRNRLVFEWMLLMTVLHCFTDKIPIK
jgi:uncharacterized membrane protein